MLNAIRSSLHQAKPTRAPLLFSPTPPGGVRFRQVAAGEGNGMSADKKQEEKTTTEKGDVMSHSYGEAYATRSDEEGFGGIYGGKQSLGNEDEDKNVHDNSTEYDKSQGSEVKEKEKARHQTKAFS